MVPPGLGVGDANCARYLRLIAIFKKTIWQAALQQDQKSQDKSLAASFVYSPFLHQKGGLVWYGRALTSRRAPGAALPTWGPAMPARSKLAAC